MVKILINDTFKQYLIKQPENYRKKVRNKFEYLEIGYWEGGLKVKKIKSIPNSKAVFEARLDRSNRILFTLGREKKNDLADQDLLIYIFGVVSHDRITRDSKNIPNNVPFLRFKPYQTESIDETLLEDLAPPYFTQESITQKVIDDSATQKWHLLNEENWDRIEGYRQDDFEMPLYLTPEQQKITEHPLPILLSGTAGSGKTTIGIYYLLKLPLAKQKKIYLTYNDNLKKYAAKFYNALLNNHPLQQEFATPDFYTFKEYCLILAKHFHKFYAEEKEITFDKFKQLILAHKPARQFDSSLIWEEIRSIIKGALPQINLKIFEQSLLHIRNNKSNKRLFGALQQQFYTFSHLQSVQKVETFIQKYLQTNITDFANNIRSYIATKPDRLLSVLERTRDFLKKERALTQRKFLSFTDYEALGRKKAPNFHKNRKNIYQIFEWYQDQLNQNSLWDELDLTREVLNMVSEQPGEENLYDLVICDEIQDLTDIQHQLFFYIVRNPLNLLLSGDTKQTINPSGFRWEELSRHFYERDMKVPDLHFLSLNFRSSGSIVELSNILLELKSNLLGVSSEELKEDWKYKGRPPVVVHDITEPKMLENVCSTGAKKTILVRTEKEKNKLKEFLGTELVFTINEAKGLEFDTVLLWKFDNDLQVQDVWKVILQDSKEEIHEARIKHEINLLYVAITRAQKDLLIYDGKQPSVIWNFDQIRDKIFSTDDLSYIGKIWNVISSPQEWKLQGNYFFDRSYFKAAIECYKNAGEENLLLRAKAFDAEKRNDHKTAAASFLLIAEVEKAAVHFEKAENYQQAYDLWKKLKNKEKISFCFEKLLEQEGRYSELAKIYKANKDYQRSYDFFIKGGAYKKAAEISHKFLKDAKSAAFYYEKAGVYQEAAKLYQRTGNIKEAAELYEKTKDYEKAIKLWKRLKQTDRLIRLYSVTKNHTELLNIYVTKKDFNSAVKILKFQQDKSDLHAEAVNLFENRKYFSALIRFSVLKKNQQKADCYFKLKNYSQASRLYQLENDYYKAALCYQKMKDNKAAFINYLKSEQDRQNDYEKAIRIGRRIPLTEIELTGHKLLEKQQYDPAAVCFSLTYNFAYAGNCHLEGGRPEEALRYWERCWHDYMMIDGIALYCLKNRLIEFGAKFILGHSSQYYADYDFNFENEASILPNLFKLMEEYFETHQDKKEIQKWISYLEYLPRYEEIELQKITYYEKSGDYNKYFRKLQDYSYYFPEFEKKLKLKFKMEQKKLVNEISELAAIKLYYLEDYSNFNRIVEQLQVTEENYEIVAVSNRYEEAIIKLLEKGNFYKTERILADRKEFLKLAQLFEKYGNLERAAHYYGVVENYQKSAELYEKTKRYSKAGDIYYKLGNFSKALEMFLASGTSKIKIARSYEKLGEHLKAAERWKAMGNMKKARICMSRIQEQSLFDQ